MMDKSDKNKCAIHRISHRFTIIQYEREHDTHLVKDESGNLLRLDLITDAAFPELNNDKELENLRGEDYYEYMEKLCGKVIECESIFPFVPYYFVLNGRFVNDA